MLTWLRWLNVEQKDWGSHPGSAVITPFQDRPGQKLPCTLVSHLGSEAANLCTPFNAARKANHPGTLYCELYGSKRKLMKVTGKSRLPCLMHLGPLRNLHLKLPFNAPILGPQTLGNRSRKWVLQLEAKTGREKDPRACPSNSKPLTGPPSTICSSLICTGAQRSAPKRCPQRLSTTLVGLVIAECREGSLSGAQYPGRSN